MNDGMLEMIRSGLFALLGLLIPLVFAIAGIGLAFWPGHTLTPLEALQKRFGLLASDKRSMNSFHRTYRILGVLLASFGLFVIDHYRSKSREVGVVASSPGSYAENRERNAPMGSSSIRYAHAGTGGLCDSES